MMNVMNMLAAAKDRLAEHEDAATRHSDPRDWERRLYHEARANAARNLVRDLESIVKVVDIKPI